MTGFQLFSASIARVKNNLPEAVAISAVIWIASIIIQLIFSESLDVEQLEAIGSGVMAPPANILRNFALMTLLTGFLTCWVAVGWHRFILLGERPKSALPRLDAKVVLAYLGWTIVIALILTLGAAFAFSFALALLPMQILVIAALPAMVLIYYASYRFSPVLVSLALLERVSLSQAWKMTHGVAGAILPLVVLNMIASVVLMLPSLFMPFGVISTLYDSFAGWVVLIVSVSQISLIYDLAKESEQ